MPRLRRSLVTENQNRICGVYSLLDHVLQLWMPGPDLLGIQQPEMIACSTVKSREPIVWQVLKVSDSTTSVMLWKKPALAEAPFSLRGGRQLQGREVESMLIFKVMLTRVEARSSPSCCLLCDVIRFSLEPMHGQLFFQWGHSH